MTSDMGAESNQAREATEVALLHRNITNDPVRQCDFGTHIRSVIRFVSDVVFWVINVTNLTFVKRIITTLAGAS